MIASALWYLARRSLRNRLVRMARRLRSPRYAIGFLAGAAYLWLVFGQSEGAFSAPGRQPFGGAGQELAALGMAMLAARWWLFGGDRGALAFSPAEVQFLFPAPLTRRVLIAWKLARAQLAVLISAVIWTALVGLASDLAFALRALAFWVLFSTLHLHQLGASLVRSSAAEQGVAGVRRHAPAIAVFAAAAGALLWSVAASVPVLREASARESWLSGLGEVLRHPAAAAVLFPFHLLLAPGFADTAAEWARAMLPAVALMLVHALWVLRSDAAFEEAAVEASARRARILQAIRERRSPGAALAAGRRVARAWLPLAPLGRPGVAILWKNLITTGRTVRLAVIARVLAGVAVGFAFASFNVEGSIVEFVGMLIAAWAGMLVVVGPVWVRNDLRQDLPKLELLRTYPLSGAAVVGAEVAASTLTLTALQLAMLALAYLLLLDTEVLLRLRGRTLLLGAALLALPALNLVSLCIQNALALLFPDIGKRGLDAPGGIESLGLNMLTILGSLLLVTATLIPPAILSALAYSALAGRLGSWSIVPVALTALAALAGEAYLIIRWLGRLFERTEPGVS